MFRQIATFAILTSVALFTPFAGAQEVRPMEPAWRIVERDAAVARSGPDAVYYTVMEFEAGRLVMADGQTEGFTRVRYPDGATLLVPVDEVRVVGQDAEGWTRVELIKASGLRAPSELMGMSGSWMTVYEPALPEGTTLRVAEAVKNDVGDVVGYRVMPVAGSVGVARMFVATAALREASPEEIESHLKGEAIKPKPVPTKPTQPAAEPETNRPATNNPEATKPDNAGTGASEPAGGEAAPVELSRGEGAGKAREGSAAGKGPSLLPADLEQLEASFEAARKQAASEVDQALDELLAEFKRTRAATDDEDRLSWQLDQRIEWLKLRIETRDQRRAIKAALAEADERAQKLQAQADEWQKSRSYQLVGMLVESSVYNGERLPRMYRVQAINSVDGSPQTLGYLMPGEGVDSKVGSVVGIIGQARFDPQLRLMVIRPERVDVMPK